MNQTELKALGAAIMAALIFLTFWCVYLGAYPNLERLGDVQTLLLAGLFYPVCEEIIFRGLIQQELLQRSRMMRKSIRLTLSNYLDLTQITVANLTTSVIFAITHAIYFQSLTALIVGIPSLIFGRCFEIKHKLPLPILTHGLFNIIGLLAPSFYNT